MTAHEDLVNRLASNLRVSHGRATTALQNSGYDYSKAVDYVVSGQEASELILSAVVRSDSIDSNTKARRSPEKENSSSGGSFGRRSLYSMLNFGSLSLSREKSKDAGASVDDDEQQASSSNKPFYRGRAISLTRSYSRDESSTKDKEKEKERAGRSRTRSTSPFRRRGKSSNIRDPSPAVEALRMSQSDAELSETEDAESQHSVTTVTSSGTGHRKRRSWGIVPRRSSFWKSGSDSESSDSSSEDEPDTPKIRSPPPEWDSLQQASDANLSSTSLVSVDLLTEANTEKNAMLGFNEDGEPLYPIEDGDVFDPLGEGVNVVRPDEPVFGPQPPPKAGSSPSAHTARRTPNRKETMRPTRLPLDTSRPSFSRDRCTLTLTHGDPAGYLRGAVEDESKVQEPKRYVVASDLSIESGYAVEWGIGTVLRDGDTMILASVQETDSKLDPEINAPSTDRVQKLRNQQERHALATLLARQVTGLLQRTKLQCTVICLAAHAKNSRRFLLDLIDYIEPTMVILGSRGRGQLKGILLGSTSHYLIQRSSVPVMVARRRLRRPARRTAHLTVQRPQPGSTSLQRGRSKLIEALIDKAGPGKVDHDVEHMREELKREETEEVASRATTKRSGLREGVGDLGVQGGVGGAME